METNPVLFMLGIEDGDRCFISNDKVYKQPKAAKKAAKKRNEESIDKNWGVVTFTPSGFNKA